MYVRSMIAGTALLALTAGCAAHRSTAPTSVAPQYVTGPVRLTDKLLKDDHGNTVTLHLDGSEAAKAQPILVTDKAGTPLKIHDYPLEDVTLCLPTGGGTPSASGTETPKHPPCEKASSVTEGTFIKFGAASCTCYIWLNRLKCYGSTCP